MSILAAIHSLTGFSYQEWLDQEARALIFECEYTTLGFFCLADSEEF